MAKGTIQIDPYDSVLIAKNIYVPNFLVKRLYDFQLTGVKFLADRVVNHNGGCLLADEMGLGKTIQAISFFASLYCSNHTSIREKHVLLILPATFQDQWCGEISKWGCGITSAVLQSNNIVTRTREVSTDTPFTIFICSYNTLCAHVQDLVKNKFYENLGYVVLDESSRIRNPEIKLYEAVKEVSFGVSRRIALCGTPIQNSLFDLWSIFDFILPGCLGTEAVFKDELVAPIEFAKVSSRWIGDKEHAIRAYRSAEVLKQMIEPHILRRTKSTMSDIIHLPEKDESTLFVNLTKYQHQKYSSVIQSEWSTNSSRLSKSYSILYQLRQVCNHPGIIFDSGNVRGKEYHRILGADEDILQKSAKFDVLRNLINTFVYERRKFLIFSQFTIVLDIIESFIKSSFRGDVNIGRVDGSTPVRSRHILFDKLNDVQDDELNGLLLTTRVGGVGVNLTGASRVVIFDPDWNPCVDTQARERSWRIGQDLNVKIFRLITQGTVEEKVYQRQMMKTQFASKVWSDSKNKLTFTKATMSEMCQIPPNVSTANTIETTQMVHGTDDVSDVKEDDLYTFLTNGVTVFNHLKAETSVADFRLYELEAAKQCSKAIKRIQQSGESVSSQSYLGKRKNSHDESSSCEDILVQDLLEWMRKRRKAHTDEILGKFSHIAESNKYLFKSILTRLCEFHKTSKSWKIKREYAET